MDSPRFDRLTIAFGNRLSRRKAIAGAASTAVAFRFSPPLRQAFAQDATPAAQTSTPTTIYVQLADSGTWTPKPGEAGVYLLTLFDPGEQTLSFTMAPDRFVATMLTKDLLDSLGFTPENPPNAAIEVLTSTGERDVLVVELMDPVYAPAVEEDAASVLIYEARVLNAYRGTGLEEWLPDVDDNQLPTEFEQVSLFIDNGCWGFSGCYHVEPDGSRGAKIGSVPSTPNLMRCPGFDPGTCVPCSGNSLATLHARCNEYYAACEGRCIAD